MVRSHLKVLQHGRHNSAGRKNVGKTTDMVDGTFVMKIKQSNCTTNAKVLLFFILENFNNILVPKF